MLKNIFNSKWNAGKEYEINFWRSYFKTEGLRWKENYKNKLNPSLPLQETIAKYIPSHLKHARILDVGAGPLTNLGKVLDACKLAIVAVDPLAEEYDSILSEFGIEPFVRTTYGEVERLSRQFKPNTFDLVHINNALDHSYNPMKGIFEMLKVVKHSHYVVLGHTKNEAERENYKGFHQWNFDYVEKQFVIWNKKHSTNVMK